MNTAVLKLKTSRLDFCRDILRFNSHISQRRLIQGYFYKSQKTELEVRMISTWIAHVLPFKSTPLCIF